MSFWLFDIVILIVAIILLLIFITLPLNLAARMLYEDDELIKAFGTAVLFVIAYVGCLAFISPPVLAILIAFIITLVLIKEIYDTTWSSAVMMWLVVIIMAIVITVIVAAIFGVELPFF